MSSSCNTCEGGKSYPFNHSHRALSKTTTARNAELVAYSASVFARGDDPCSCEPATFVDEYGRQVGIAGYKNAGANACNVGVRSSEYRMNVETATRPNFFNSYGVDSKFDNLSLGRDLADADLQASVSCMVPKAKKAPRACPSKSHSSMNRTQY